MKKFKLFLFLAILLKLNYSMALCNAYFTWSYDPFGPSPLFFSDSSNGTIGSVTYQWDFGDGSPIDTTQNPIHWLINETDVVCLTITDSTGCTSTYCDSLFHIFVSTSEINKHKIQLKLFPNPSIEKCMIYFRNNHLKTISVSDILGKEVFRTSSSTESYLLNTEKFANGIYTLQIKYENNNIETAKLIISH